jgi:alpha-galactosidase
LHNPITDRATDAEIRYRHFADALDGGVFFAINTAAATPEEPDTWTHGIAGSSRVLASEVTDFGGAKAAYEAGLALTLARMPVQGAEHFLDLGAINMGLSAEEVKSQFALWSMLNSPLILSGTVEQLADEPKIGIITNDKLIAINQEFTRFQAERAHYGNDIDAIIKPLENGRAALVVFNKGGAAAGNVTLDLWKLLGQHLAAAGFSAPLRATATEVFGGAMTTVRKGTLAIGNIPASGTAAYMLEQPPIGKR